MKIIFFDGSRKELDELNKIKPGLIVGEPEADGKPEKIDDIDRWPMTFEEVKKQSFCRFSRVSNVRLNGKVIPGLEDGKIIRWKSLRAYLLNEYPDDYFSFIDVNTEETLSDFYKLSRENMFDLKFDLTWPDTASVRRECPGRINKIVTISFPYGPPRCEISTLNEQD